MRYIFSLLFLLLSCIVNGQPKPNIEETYSPLISYGKIPNDFRTMSVEKFIEDKGNLGREDSRKDRKAKTEFLLSSNYGIDNLLQSGNVVFGDPVTKYINKVADKLLAKKPTLRKELRFYTFKSPEVNAFSTNQGIVFVNIGLVAQVQNEAQLAFVLAHEIGHYVEKHVINAYVDAVKISKDKNLRKLGDESIIRELSNYSKENEFDADEFALKMLLETEYSIEAASGVFDVLKYSYLPFDEVVFDTTFFNSGDYILSKYFLNKVQEIKVEDDYDDSKSSHPNIRKRISKFETILEKNKSKSVGTETFLTSEEEFEYAQWICRFEMSRIYLTKLDYPMAIYNSYLILQKFPDNSFAHAVIGKSLHYLAKYKTSKSKNSLRDEKLKILGLRRTTVIISNSSKSIKYSDKEGEVQQVFYFLDKIPGNELAILSSKYLWESYIKYGDKHGLEYYATESMKDLVYLYDIKYKYFSKNSKEENLKQKEEEDSIVSTDTTSKVLSKYDKIKKKTKTDEQSLIEEYQKYAFTESLIENKLFISAYNDVEEAYDKEKSEVDEINRLSLKEKSAILKRIDKRNKHEKKHGRSLGIDKLVLVEPFYYKGKIHSEKGVKLNLIESEYRKKWYNDRLEQNAKEAKLDLNLLTYDKLEEDDVDIFNDLSYLREWLRERLALKNSISQVSEFERIKNFTSKYGTDYIAMNGVYNARVISNERKTYAAVMLFTIFFTPVGIYEFSYKKYQTEMSSIVFNISNGDIVFVNETQFKTKDARDYINSELYKLFFQLKRKPKK